MGGRALGCLEIAGEPDAWDLGATVSDRALDGASAVVTGASGGIGLAIARVLVLAGARVILVARRQAALEREARGLGERAMPLVCDLAVGDEVDRAVAQIGESLGVPDVVVSNAGAFAIAPVGVMPPAEMERMVRINLLAPYRLLHAMVPRMTARGSGHIVTIGSIADRQTFTENAAYAATKFGARAMHQVLRDELRGSGVRASLVSPGPVDTPLWDPIAPETRPGFTPRSAMLRADAVADAVLWVVTRPTDVNIDELRLSRS